MAAQGPQATLGGATRGDVIEAKGLAEGRDSLGHGHAVGLLLLASPSRAGPDLAEGGDDAEGAAPPPDDV